VSTNPLTAWNRLQASLSQQVNWVLVDRKAVVKNDQHQCGGDSPNEDGYEPLCTSRGSVQIPRGSRTPRRRRPRSPTGRAQLSSAKRASRSRWPDQKLPPSQSSQFRGDQGERDHVGENAPRDGCIRVIGGEDVHILTIG
jgi:hypothetical protein